MNRLPLAQWDPEIAHAIDHEIDRLEYTLEMIPSENYVSKAVLEALGTVMTIKYAEGYPGKRYYGGCEFVDQVEELARARAKQIFGADHVNVQPHSGSQANMAAYFAVCKPGDTILGMNLSQGGHLTHGSPVSFSGQLYHAISYGVHPETELLDYHVLADLARQHRPKMIVAGGSAYSRDIDFKIFREIADAVGAYLLADIAHPAGLVASGCHTSPVPYAHFVTTTTHKTLRGPRGGMIMCQAEFAKPVDKLVFPGLQGGPLMHVIAAKAVAFKEALAPDFQAYGRQVVANCRAVAAGLMDRGYRIVTGGTDTHLCLVDLTAHDLSGKDAEAALERAGITVNKNTIPRETRSPFVTSGIRCGTPCLTTRGMGEGEMQRIAGWMADVLDRPTDETLQRRIRAQVKELCAQFPMYR